MMYVREIGRERKGKSVSLLLSLLSSHVLIFLLRRFIITWKVFHYDWRITKFVIDTLGEAS